MARSPGSTRHGPSPSLWDVQRVRAYLTALLPPGEVEEALEEVIEQADYWRDRELVDLLAHAHISVRARITVAPERERRVLTTDVGLDPPVAQAIAGAWPSAVLVVPEARPGRARAVQGPIGEDTTGPEPTGREPTDPGPPESIVSELRRRFHHEDLSAPRYGLSRRLRLMLVATALVAFLGSLVLAAL